MLTEHLEDWGIFAALRPLVNVSFGNKITHWVTNFGEPNFEGKLIAVIIVGG